MTYKKMEVRTNITILELQESFEKLVIDYQGVMK